MKLLITIVARLGLALTLLPCLLYLAGGIDLSMTKLIMIIGTVLWLGAAPVVQRLHEATE